MDVNSNNSYSISELDFHQYSQDISYIIVFSIIVLLTLFGNAATILSFWKVPTLREKPSNLLILNLSIADFGIGLLETYNFPWNKLSRPWPYGKLGCQFGVLFTDIFVSMGIVTTLAITYDRFLLIAKDYPKYVKTQSRLRIKLTVLTIWLYGTSIGIFELIMWDIVKLPAELKGYFDYDKDCRPPVRYNSITSLTSSILIIFAPLLATEFFSIAFVVLLYRRLRRPVAVNPSSVSGSGTSQRREFESSFSQGNSTSRVGISGVNPGVNHGNNPERPPANSRKRYRKAAAVLGALVTVLNICLLPYVLYNLIVSFVCPQCNSRRVRDFLADILYLNSCINPFLYAITISKIRDFYKRILCRG